MEGKKEKLKIIVISAIISTIVSLIGCMSLIRWANGLNLSVDDFTVSDIIYSSDKGTYYTSYEGEARIYCKDITDDYIIVVSMTLISGGNSSKVGGTTYGTVIIHNGVGTISTYDYGETITQPNYQIEVLGFKKLSK